MNHRVHRGIILCVLKKNFDGVRIKTQIKMDEIERKNKVFVIPEYLNISVVLCG